MVRLESRVRRETISGSSYNIDDDDNDDDDNNNNNNNISGRTNMQFTKTNM